MNDFIWFCLKSVQLMTFQVSSFYPEIDYKNLLITFFREKSQVKLHKWVSQSTTNLNVFEMFVSSMEVF